MARVVVSVTQSLPFRTDVAVVQFELQLWDKELEKLPTWFPACVPPPPKESTNEKYSSSSRGRRVHAHEKARKEGRSQRTRFPADM